MSGNVQSSIYCEAEVVLLNVLNWEKLLASIFLCGIAIAKLAATQTRK